MPRARRVAIVLTAATLAVVPAAVAQSGGAGDNQYQDPFGSGQSSGGSTTTHHSSSSTSGSSNGLSQSPNLSPSSGTASSTATSPASSSATSATGNHLPNTGSDPRLIVLAGLALLLFGIGLRLRTADEIF